MAVWPYCGHMDIATLTGTPSETLAGLSLASGITRTTLRRRLHHPGQFTLDEIDAIARATSTDPDELLARIAEWKQAAA